MSYILEALKKSQREHARGNVPTLDGVVPAPGSPGPRIGPLLVSLLLGALLALLIVGYLVTLQNQGTSPLPPSKSVSDNNPPDDSGPGSNSVPKPGRTAVSHPLQSARVDPKPARPAEPEAAQSATVSPPATSRRANITAPPAKAWSELPADIRVAIGNLVLNIHVYSERPDKRFVFINEREYREGNVLNEGPTLEAISPKGLVLTFRGERFRLDM